MDTTTLTARRQESIEIAIAAGATQDVIDAIAAAKKLARKDTICLPEGRYSHCARAKGWARFGRGSSAVWGRKEDGGYRVGEGNWTVSSSDGYSREERKEWIVRHVTVGDQVWTVAS